MISNTEENYLKGLFMLSVTKGEANVNELSKLLDIKMPTVNSMMKKLAEKKLVIYQSYKPIKLTEEGKKAAALIVRKHRLTEMFLVEKMGFGWDEVHEIAEQVEHIQSPLFFKKMDEILGHPKIDPHGSPIPDKDGNIDNPNYHQLNECEVGQSVILKAVRLSSDTFLKFLNAHQMSLGTIITITAKEEFDGNMTLSYGDQKSQVFSYKACERLLVEKQ
ncbi:metal-dependent transcriptional regulator [Sphingobacterium sp. UT-1RO-CII-1]|uniref:metal-dependent transcriptional regulator n=1 Tax=Sphingobacterium sp. UT-1RO-CII-1 TaxID=2995225 RepID=UPI00227B4236|nr:metal-dependent transcriptional regulator [Sphingobacterium sp. UT-1RO-CII-1]MCY4780719.1 metal-dependent transcriptional regulator [Sphingobacterium sp. UT-1RO-CII-1]